MNTIDWQYHIAKEIIQRLDMEQIRHLCQRLATDLSAVQLAALIARLELIMNTRQNMQRAMRERG